MSGRASPACIGNLKLDFEGASLNGSESDASMLHEWPALIEARLCKRQLHSLFIRLSQSTPEHVFNKIYQVFNLLNSLESVKEVTITGAKNYPVEPESEPELFPQVLYKILKKCSAMEKFTLNYLRCSLDWNVLEDCMFNKNIQSFCVRKVTGLDCDRLVKLCKKLKLKTLDITNQPGLSLATCFEQLQSETQVCPTLEHFRFDPGCFSRSPSQKNNYKMAVEITNKCRVLKLLRINSAYHSTADVLPIIQEFLCQFKESEIERCLCLLHQNLAPCEQKGLLDELRKKDTDTHIREITRIFIICRGNAKVELGISDGFVHQTDIADCGPCRSDWYLVFKAIHGFLKQNLEISVGQMGVDTWLLTPSNWPLVYDALKKEWPDLEMHQNRHVVTFVRKKGNPVMVNCAIVM